MNTIKAALICQGSVSSQWTIEAMKKYFEVVDELSIKHVETVIAEKSIEVLHHGTPLQPYDCIYAKGSYRYESLLRSITEACFDRCYMPIHPETFSIGHDKLLTHLALQRKNVPMPKTYVTTSIASTRGILEKVTYPIIMKFTKGTQGKGVMFAESLTSASTLLDAMDVLKQPLIIQEYIETGGIDTRAFVVGDQVVAACRRSAAEGDVRSNIHAGAEGEKIMLDAKSRRIAVDTAQAVGADVCAVDMVQGPHGPLVLEVNLSPGLQGITKISGVDIAAKIAAFLYEQTRLRKTSQKKEKEVAVLEELGILGDKASTQKISGMIVPAEMRGERLLLPKNVTHVAELREKDELQISVEKGKIDIRKL